MMRSMRWLTVVALGVSIAAGCSQGVNLPEGGADATSEAATGDASAEASNDAGFDAGPPVDVITPTDVQPSDVPITQDVSPTVDVPSPTDASDVTTIGDGGVCTFGGDYSFSLMGTMFYFRFSPDGTWTGAMTQAELGAPGAPGGSWSISGSRFTIHDGSTTGGGGCPPDQEGAYDVSFGSDCSVTLTLVSEPCGGRGMVLGGATLTPVGG